MTTQPSQDLHNRGWGYALLIIVIAIVVNGIVFSIHKKTYLAPPSGPPTAGAER